MGRRRSIQADGISGIERWLNRAWNVALIEPDYDEGAARDLRHLTHQTIKRVTEDFDGFRWNTALAALMEMVNGLYKTRDAGAVDPDAGTMRSSRCCS